jgi:hypothetical protein
MQLVRLYAQAQADPQLASNFASQARALAAQGEQVQMPTTALPPVVQEALDLRAPATQPARGATTQPAGAATPGATAPGTATPGTTTPGTATPGTATPGTTPGATPGATTPDAGDQPAPAGATPPPAGQAPGQ